MPGRRGESGLLLDGWDGWRCQFELMGLEIELGMEDIPVGAEFAYAYHFVDSLCNARHIASVNEIRTSVWMMVSS